MSPAIAKHAPLMDRAALYQAAKLTGPCITITVPSPLAITPQGSVPNPLTSLLQSAADRVAGLKLSEAVPILKRLEEFASGLAAHTPDHGAFALFCSPEASARFEASEDGAPRMEIGSYPYLKPFIRQASCPHSALILCLSRKQLRLSEFTAGICRPLSLPDGVPAGLGEAGVDHGTASPDTTSEDEHGLGQFEHFLALADQGIRPHLAGRPLILAGSREEIAAYRRISHQEHLLHAELDGNCDFQTEQNLAEAAVGALEKEADRLAALAFAHFEQKLERTRTLTDPEDILLNAAEGRVHQLFLQRGAEHLRKLPRRLDRARLPQEDWVNAAACETLRHKGEVFELAAPLGAAARPLAAILRY